MTQVMFLTDNAEPFPASEKIALENCFKDDRVLDGVVCIGRYFVGGFEVELFCFQTGLSHWLRIDSETILMTPAHQLQAMVYDLVLLNEADVDVTERR